jgi:hypothetical protein
VRRCSGRNVGTFSSDCFYFLREILKISLGKDFGEDAKQLPRRVGEIGGLQ